MTKNVGNIDRILRFVVGIVLLIAAFTTGLAATGWIFWAMIIVGLVAVGTALIGNCPLYSILGIRTCGK